MTISYPHGEGEVTITTPEASDSVLNDSDHAFLVEHWYVLAAAAYRSFRELGVGVLIADYNDLKQTGENDLFTRLQLGYAPDQSAWLTSGLSTGVSTWLDEQLQTYETTEEVIFLFLGGEAPPRVYRVSGSPTPRAAYRAVRARFN